MEILIYILSILIYKQLNMLLNNNKMIINLLIYYYFIIIISLLLFITKIYMYLCTNYEDLFNINIFYNYINYEILKQYNIEYTALYNIVSNIEYTILYIKPTEFIYIDISNIKSNELVNTLFFICIISIKIPYIWCELYALHNLIITIPNEITLIFFRIYNPNIYALNVIILYFVYPSIYISFIIKLQCFCYDNLFIFPLETLELPILFYLNINISTFFFNNYIIKINYLLLFNSI
jgi:hypothetical protein